MNGAPNRTIRNRSMSAGASDFSRLHMAFTSAFRLSPSCHLPRLLAVYPYPNHHRRVSILSAVYLRGYTTQLEVMQ